MAVLLRSDIAKLVLDYLQDQDLKETYDSFLRTSRYLREEYKLLQKGYRTNRLHDIKIVEMLDEYTEVKCSVMKYIESLPNEISSELLQYRSLATKVEYILDNFNDFQEHRSKVDTGKRRRISSDENDSDALYQPSKRTRLSSQMIPNQIQSSNNVTPENESDELINLSTIKKSNANNTLNETPTFRDNKELKIFSDTILQNTHFQNVLVENINKMLETPQYQSTSTSSSTMPNTLVQCQPQKSTIAVAPPRASSSSLNNDYPQQTDVVTDRSLQEQLDAAIHSIIQTTEENPIFDEVLMDCVNQSQTTQQFQHQDVLLQQQQQQEDYQSTLRCSTPQNSDDSVVDLNIPIKERLRKNRVKSYAEETASKSIKSRMMRNNKKSGVKVLSNERYTGPLSADVINCIPTETGKEITTTITGATNVTSTTTAPVQQLYIINTSAGSYFTTGLPGAQIPGSCTQLSDQEAIFINIPSVVDQMPIILNASSDTINLLQSQSQSQLQQSNEYVQSSTIETDTALTEVIFPSTSTNSAENVPITDSSTSAMQPNCTIVNAIEKKSPAENEKLIENNGKTPKTQIARTIFIKGKSLSTPRRKTSHVRALDFNTPANFDKFAVISESQPKMSSISAITTTTMTVTTTATTTSTNTTTISDDLPLTSSPVVNSKDLRGDWDQVHGVGAIVKQTNINDTESGEVISNYDEDEKTSATVNLPMTETPKVRKIERRSCVRVLSANKNMHKKGEKSHGSTLSVGSSVHCNDKEKLKNCINENETVTNENVTKLDEWTQYRSINKNQWDQHLRVATDREQIKTGKRIPVRRKKRLQSSHSKSNLNDSPTVTVPVPVHPTSGGAIKPKVKTKFSPMKRPIMLRRKTTFAIKLSPKKLKKSPKMKNTKKIVSNTKRLAAIDLTEKIATASQPNHSSAELSTNSTKITPDNPPPTVQNEKTALKCSVNIASLLETPFKDDALSEIPPTPRFAIPTPQQTPFVKVSNFSCAVTSSLKCPEFPTPNFPITPGIKKTPHTTSPKSGGTAGGYSSRITDYSSGGSYYKPDESDEIDKMFDTAIRVTESQDEDNVDDQPANEQEIVENDKHEDYRDADENDPNVSTSSNSSSSSSSSQSSSSSSSSSDTSSIVKKSTTGDIDQKPPEQSTNANPTTETQLQSANLELTRKRMIGKLKSSTVTTAKSKQLPAKSKLPISFVERKQMLEIKKATTEIQNEVVNRNLTTIQQSSIGKSPSKRKIRIPSKVIYVDKLSDIEQSNSANTNDRLLGHINDNAALDTIEHSTKPLSTTKDIIPSSSRTDFKPKPHKIDDDNHPLVNAKKPAESQTPAKKLSIECKRQRKIKIEKEIFGESIDSDYFVVTKPAEPTKKPVEPQTPAKKLSINRQRKIEIEKEIFGESIDSDYLETPMKANFMTNVKLIESSQIKTPFKNNDKQVPPIDLSFKSPVQIDSVTAPKISTSTPIESNVGQLKKLPEPPSNSSNKLPSATIPVKNVADNSSTSSTDDDDDDDEDYDIYDDCTLSYETDKNLYKNELNVSIVSTNENPVLTHKMELPRIITTSLMINNQKIRLCATNEIDLWPVPLKNDNLTLSINRQTKTKEKRNILTVPKVNFKYQSSDNVTPAERNVKEKPASVLPSNCKETVGNALSNESSTEPKIIQQSNKDIDINLVLRKVHPPE